jgi:hypothetical protein
MQEKARWTRPYIKGRRSAETTEDAFTRWTLEHLVALHRMRGDIPNPDAYYVVVVNPHNPEEWSLGFVNDVAALPLLGTGKRIARETILRARAYLEYGQWPD